MNDPPEFANVRIVLEYDPTDPPPWAGPVLEALQRFGGREPAVAGVFVEVKRGEQELPPGGN